VFRRRKPVDGEETVDVAARLHPYEELFNEAMTMAARFSEDRARRDREAARQAGPAPRRLVRRAS
jgi:hypothetical protein